VENDCELILFEPIDQRDVHLESSQDVVLQVVHRAGFWVVDEDLLRALWAIELENTPDDVQVRWHGRVRVVEFSYWLS